MSPNDNAFMEEAFCLAEEALLQNEVPVGCIFVFNGQTIGKGRNRSNETRNPTTHAEITALRDMEKMIPNLTKILPETTLYVTLEPCVMCAAAMYELGIKRIVYGAENDRFGGITSIGDKSKYKRTTDIEICGLIQAERSIALLKKFYERENPYTPEEKRLKKHKFCVIC